MRIRGRAWVFGDDVDTDQIISGKYLTLRDSDEMAKHVFESVKPDFAGKVTPSDVLVAGRNFGSGSSREEAPVLLKKLGLSLIIARGFARLFFRNAINIGLPVLESREASEKVSEGDMLEVDLESGIIHNATKREDYAASKLPEFLLNTLKTGGAVQAYRDRSHPTKSEAADQK